MSGLHWNEAAISWYHSGRLTDGAAKDVRSWVTPPQRGGVTAEESAGRALLLGQSTFRPRPLQTLANPLLFVNVERIVTTIALVPRRCGGMDDAV
jgi:hypothetical protein